MKNLNHDFASGIEIRIEKPNQKICWESRSWNHTMAGQQGF